MFSIGSMDSTASSSRGWCIRLLHPRVFRPTPDAEGGPGGVGDALPALQDQRGLGVWVREITPAAMPE